MNSEIEGNIFSVQKMVSHDGAGWRTLIFFKGCPLRCKWCCNPESLSREPVLAFNQDRCIGSEQCRVCIENCPQAAISAAKGDASIAINRVKCDLCGDCAGICPAKAFFVYGETVTASALLKTIEEDSVFYSRSGGGVTLSGGEPLLQADFLTDFLEKCQRRGLHITVETCGDVPWANLEKTIPFIDQIIYDIKSADPELHKAYTGVSNQRILKNLDRLNQHFPQRPITVRTPIITGFNDTPEHISKILKLIAPLSNVTGYELMPYHRFGSVKYH
jgi:pyruvate formate lyase activating enzyme